MLCNFGKHLNQTGTESLDENNVVIGVALIGSIVAFFF